MFTPCRGWKRIGRSEGEAEPVRGGLVLRGVSGSVGRRKDPDMRKRKEFDLTGRREPLRIKRASPGHHDRGSRSRRIDLTGNAGAPCIRASPAATADHWNRNGNWGCRTRKDQGGSCQSRYSLRGCEKLGRTAFPGRLRGTGRPGKAVLPCLTAIFSQPLSGSRLSSAFALSAGARQGRASPGSQPSVCWQVAGRGSSQRGRIQTDI